MKKLLIPLLLLALSAPALAADCFISEYSVMPTDRNGNIVPVPQEPVAATPQVVTVDTESDSSAFADSTRYIGIICDSKTHYLFGFSNPTATTSSPYLPADTLRYFGISSSSVIVSLLVGT